MVGKCKCMRLSAVAFGVSLGLLSGLIMLFGAWAAMWWGVGTAMVDQWASVFPGISATLAGGFVALAWGFLEGFIIGSIWALLYNLCLCCCRCGTHCKCCNNSECATK